jgi:hypothetical protein
MTCAPSNKVKQFANKYKNIIKKLGLDNNRKFDDDIKFIVMTLIAHSIKTIGIDDTASLVYNFFPNIIVEKILAHLNNYESKCEAVDCDQQIQELKDDNLDTIESSEKPWLINFYSTKCSHCMNYAQIWKMVPSLIDGMNVGEVNIDNSPEWFKRFNIETVPNIILLKDGKRHSLINGSFTIENIVDFVQHPETYNDRSDDEIDCSNIIKNLIHLFTIISKDNDYLYRHLKFQKKRETLKSLSRSLSKRRI